VVSLELAEQLLRWWSRIFFAVTESLMSGKNVKMVTRMMAIAVTAFAE
jgi:hypothetical protein